MADGSLKVAIVGLQPNDPGAAGADTRLVGLYGGLGKSLPTTFVAASSRAGGEIQRRQLSDTLQEIIVPMSAEHLSACEDLQTRVKDAKIFEPAFHRFAHLSPQFVDAAKSAVSESDIVIFSQPWVFPELKDGIRKREQLIVYDSRAFEALKWLSLLEDDGPGTELAREVMRIECDLCVSADLIFTSSHRDRKLFNRFLEIPFGKMRVIFDGISAGNMPERDNTKREEARKTLGIGNRCLAVFLGGSDPTDVEAAEFIRDELAPELPEVEFAICGEVADASEGNTRSGKQAGRVRFIAFSDVEEKDLYLSAADMAIRPKLSGSVSGERMVEFMASGLPIVATPAGAGEIEQGPDTAYIKCARDSFVSEIEALADDPALRAQLSESAMSMVGEKYSWERIAANVGRLLHRHRAGIADQRPFFSVIIASYDRHKSLYVLMDRLSSQAYGDFEVIIVEQTPGAWPGGDRDYGFDLLYVHTDIKGAIRARNLAALLARGEVIAFTDDDCEPRPDWLKNARRYLGCPGVIGVEGLITSDKRDDPNYRTVSNEGFEGMGFMAANLFLKLDVFHATNGFDERFDNPHFREDTDLAWRALAYGKIPFANDVEVFHPPQPRNIERESSSARARFFENDALLLEKHPLRYKTLFMSERHWEKTPGFWENFLRGAKKYGVEMNCNVSVIGSQRS